jgi:hypothetical protein
MPSFACEASDVETTAETLSDAAAHPGCRVYTLAGDSRSATVAPQPPMLFLQSNYSDISATHRALVAKPVLSARLTKSLI